MRKNPLAAPVIKWFGGKQTPPEELSPLFPKRITSYCEPFLGNGAVLFWLQPASACLCDINPGLIEMYETVRDQAEELIAALERHPNLENHYRLVRNWDRDKRQYGKLSCVQRAARMIYLSRTCYNGLYHSLEESDVFLETLTKIFGDRILFCNSCDICDFYKIHSSSLNVEN